jgi:hypothetical protein
MKALRTFLIASAVALVLVPQVAPGWIRGAAIASLISLVTGNVALYVNPSGSGTTPCGVNGGSTCQAGSDSNTCLTIAAPCKTLQNALYIMNQTLLWSFNVGSAVIYTGNGTYPETPQFGSPIGFPKCFTCNANYGYSQIEIFGNDASPSSVVISPPNGTCNKGDWGGDGAVLLFYSGNYNLHGISANATSEATYVCNIVSAWTGTKVQFSGTNNFGPSSGRDIFNLEGGGEVFVTGVANITVGTGLTQSVVDIFNGGQWLDDGATINFIGSGTILGGGQTGVIRGDSTGINTFGSYDTITGSVGGPCYWLVGSTNLAGANNGVMKQQIVSGCSVASSLVYQGTNFQGYFTASGLATHYPYNQSPSASPPAVSSCGSGASIDTNDTDTSGTITVGSGATGCTVTFQSQTWLQLPDCIVTGGLAVTPIGSSPYTGWSVTSGSISGTKLVYHCLFHM